MKITIVSKAKLGIYSKVKIKVVQKIKVLQLLPELKILKVLIPWMLKKVEVHHWVIILTNLNHRVI